jgi:hypothetical protein
MSIHVEHISSWEAIYLSASQKKNSQVSWYQGGTRWRSCFRHYATSRKVACSIPDGVTGIFHLHNPSDRTMALASTRRLTEISTRNISWRVKVAGAYGWQHYRLKLLDRSGPVQACNGIALPHLWVIIRVMHLGLVDRPFVPQIWIVPSFISRGTLHHAARETSISEGRKLHTNFSSSP